MMKKGAKSLFVACGMLAFLLIGAFLFFSLRTPRDIKLVIPNDYSGELVIEFDERHGMPPEKGEHFWIYYLGDDGKLVTSNKKPFSNWHQLRVEFRDGRVITDYATDTFSAYGYEARGGQSKRSGKSGSSVVKESYHWQINKLE